MDRVERIDAGDAPLDPISIPSQTSIGGKSLGFLGIEHETYVKHLV